MAGPHDWPWVGGPFCHTGPLLILSPIPALCWVCWKNREGPLGWGCSWGGRGQAGDMSITDRVEVGGVLGEGQGVLWADGTRHPRMT
jgi:hypothetical protein